MLLELRVENLLLIERAELRLGPGLNVITGETGAGKTVLAHALDLLLGGKPRPGIVRPGAAEAYVEGVFTVPPGLFDGLDDLRERLPDDEEEIVLGRRVGAEGRTRAFVQGRAATAADLRELGGRLVAFYGQHEHRRLTLASAQLRILDAFCGPAHLGVLERYAAVHARVAAIRRELSELQARAGARDRDRDLLAFEIEEIEALDPSVEDERSLRAERERLRRIDGLRAAAGAGAEALAPASGDGPGVATTLGETERLADSVAGADPEPGALAMEDAAFETVLEERDELGAAGAERVELTIAPNPGVPPAPLRETASGGELSRTMLALMSVANSGGSETLVFDEVDAGIGGQTARAVGERLRRLAESRQVVCITHLPQIASLAERHFRIEKKTAGDLARTSVEWLDDGQVVEELCRMLGADTDDAGARRHAEELLAAA